MGKEMFPWKQTIVEQCLRAVEIGQNQVEQPRTLGHARGQKVPLGSIDDYGHQIQRPGAVPMAVDVLLLLELKGGSVIANHPPAVLDPPVQLAGAQSFQDVNQRPPVAADGAVGRHELVIVARYGLV